MKTSLYVKLSFPLQLLPCIMLWEGACVFLKIPTYILPPFHKVVEIFYTKRTFIFHHAGISMVEVVSALAFGIVIAFMTAIALHQYPRFRHVIMPYLLTMKNMPIFVFAPMFMLWCGHGVGSKIILITMSCYFPMALGLLDGFAQIPLSIKDFLSYAPQKNHWKELFWINIPYALPGFFTGLKLAFLHGPVSVIACDWIGATHGLGYVMLLAYGQMDLEMMFACLSLMLITGVVLYKISNKVEDWALKKLNMRRG